MFKKEIMGVPRMHIRIPNPNVVMYGVIDHYVSIKDIQEAIRSLSNKHMLLNCHFETGDENKVWYVIDKQLPPAVYTPRSNSLNEILEDELKHCFDLESGPLIRFNLVNQTESTLIINCHHAICDGMSLVYLFNDIVSVLSGKFSKSELKKPIFLEPENIPQRVGSPISRLFIHLINKKWRKRTISFSHELYQKVHESYWKECKPRILTSKWSKEETSNIVSQCKNNHVSVNTGLVTAFLYAEKKLFDLKDYSSKVIVTDDLRTHLVNQPGDRMGNYISTLRPNLVYREDRTFWENAQFFHKKIRRPLEKDPFKRQLIGLLAPKFLDVMMLNSFGEREDRLAQKLITAAGMNTLNSTFTIANLGRVNINDDPEKLKVSTLLGPIAVSNAMEKYIGVLTINNALHFSICFNEHIIDEVSILKTIDFITKMFGKDINS